MYRKCEICSGELTKQQKRFCSGKCRGIHQKEIITEKMKSWPPLEGNGRLITLK